VLRSRERDSVQTDGSVLHSLDTLGRPNYETLGTVVAERDSGIIFVAGNLIAHAKVRLAAELAKRDGYLLVGLVPGLHLSNLDIAESLRLMLRFCDTIVIVDPINNSPHSGSVRLQYSDVAFEICKGLTNNSCRRLLRSMLKRGQLARVTWAKSTSSVEEALLKALRTLLPVAEFSHKPEVFLSIIGREIDHKTLARVSKWISDALHPSDTIICTYRENGVKARVYLVVTGITFPHSASSRRLSIDIDELEPESNKDNEMALALGLDQME